MKVKNLKKIKEQKGIALLTSILLLGALGVLGFTAVNVSNIDTKITSNTKTSKQAFYLAEAGAEQARELLRVNLAGGTTLSSQLNSVKGSDGVLTNSNNATNFSSSDDVPFINTTTFGKGSFKVYLTNDSVDGVTNTTDTNGIVTLTAFGYGPDNAVAIVQTTVLKGGGITLPNLPGAITLAGPNVVFNAPDSNAFVVNGYDHPAIAVNSTASYNTITNDKTVIKRSDQYLGVGGTPSVQNLDFPPPWDVITDLDSVYTTLKNGADYTSPSAPGFTLGTTDNRKVVVIDGDYTIDAATGAGILLVTGKLTLHGAFNYDGIILVIGNGNILRNGAGNGIITGGIYVANIKGADHQIDTPDDTFITVTFETTGGGNSTIEYNAADQTDSSNLTNRLPFVKKTWKQITT
jgi:Tfp pilus assembly protein PilX